MDVWDVVIKYNENYNETTIVSRIFPFKIQMYLINFTVENCCVLLFPFSERHLSAMWTKLNDYSAGWLS